jgi:hypothetical protein
MLRGRTVPVNQDVEPRGRLDQKLWRLAAPVPTVSAATREHRIRAVRRWGLEGRRRGHTRWGSAGRGP